MDCFYPVQGTSIRFLFPFILFWILSASHLFAAVATSPDDAAATSSETAIATPPQSVPTASVTSSAAFSTFTLDNGLHVLVKEMPAAPVVAVNVWIHVGSRNEKKGEEGFSHLIEHMMFKGTATYTVGQLDKEIKKMGAANNAFTASDYTCYHVLGAREHFPRLMALEADAILHSSFVEEEFQKERSVVLEEMRMDKDDPESLVYNQTKETAYKVHPYRHPIVGYHDQLASATRDQVFGYYKKYYVPSNMWVIIAGDIKASEALETVKACMGSAHAAPVPDQVVPAEPPQERRCESRLYGDIQQSYINLAWHAPGIQNPDNYVMDVISTLMGHGRSSRLFKILVEQERLASDLSTSYFTSGDPSLFIISAQIQQSNRRKFIDRAAKLMSDLKEGAIPAEEFEKVKQQLIATTIFGKETAESQAQNYGHYATLGHLDEADSYVDRIREVTLEDVKRVAKATFNDHSLSVISYEPQNTVQSAKPEMITLDNGIKLILRENHTAPIVAMAIQIDAGGLREGKNEAGLANLAASTLSKGTEKHSAEELAHLFESIGASVSIQAQKSYVTFKTQSLSEKFPTTLDLVMEILTSATFPEEEFKKEQEKTLDAIKSQQDDLFYYTYYQGLAALFTDSPLGYSNLGLPDQIRNIKQSECANFFKKHYVGSGMVVAISGDIYPGEVRDRLAAVFSNISKGNQSDLKEAKLEDIDNVIEVNGQKNREQAQVLVATRTFPRSDSRGPAMDIVKSILGGSMSSRLFTNLRDKDSLAYSVWASQVGTRNLGYFFATLSTAVSKLDTAKSRLIEELEKFRKDGFTDEEFNDAKTYIIGMHALNLVDNQSMAETLSSDEFFGLGFDYYSRYPEMIKAVTKESVHEIAQKFLLGSGKYVIAVTKPSAK
ncbi:MAG: insulinase family protein [Candidatus Riflebacteria bacterium]|nr:insulinase family protein [Candidatus Riflebacteria bacterium]